MSARDSVRGAKETREIPKKTIACSACRMRKVRCDKNRPCGSCSSYGYDCVYPISRQGQGIRRRTTSTIASTSNSPNRDPGGIEWTAGGSLAEWPRRPLSSQQARPSLFPSLQPASFSTGDPTDKDFEIAQSNEDQIASSTSMVDPRSTIPTCDAIERQSSLPPDKEDINLPPHESNWEHQGPLSWIAICSQPGVSWVAQRTGVPDFAKTARNFVATWTKRLKVDRTLLSGEPKEPDRETAWRYCQAYFDESYDAAFGLVDRPEFEVYLQNHFDGKVLNDSSWYALRQTVYASGCRILLSRDPAYSFSQVQNQAWGFFRNAMSVFSELLFTFTGLMAVRALIAMSFFSEGAGSPALQYMLCSNAARLAQSKGLHRQAGKSWKIPETEIINRNWLFWAIYCSEKHIALRSSRPSAIDDREISCQIPTRANSGSTIQVSFFTSMITQSRIASRISTDLTSVYALQQSPSVLLGVALELETELIVWRQSIPELIRPWDHTSVVRIAQGSASLSALMLSYVYYSSILAIHTIFMNPWIGRVCGHSPFMSKEEASLRAEGVANAARNLILLSTRREINAASPFWSCFSYPMMGLTNLFIFILNFPHLPSTHSDIALLDIAAGHFGCLQFVTNSDLRFDFARELASLARQAVDNAASPAIVQPLVDRNDSEEQNVELDMGTADEFFASLNPVLDDWSVLSTVFFDGALDTVT